MTGDYTPKSRLEVGKAAKGVEGLSDAELAEWIGEVGSDQSGEDEGMEAVG
jgi:hypothetical protein